MNATTIKVTALSVSCACLFSACDSVEGARFAQSFAPRFYVYGPGFHRTFEVPVETFMSPRLKFQTAVVKGDVAAARHNLQQSWVEAPIHGAPPIYYAAISGNSAMIRLLVENGASVGTRPGGRSLAYLAAANGHPGTAAELAEMGGGTSGDIDRGKALYAENAARQRRQVAAIAAGVLLLLDAASRSGPASGPSNNVGGSGMSESQIMALDRQVTQQRIQNYGR
jgi:hypothetical protein